MDSILDYKFFLNFKNPGTFGLKEITEVEGFDGSVFTVQQEESRYGRDVFKMNEEIDLVFKKGSFDAKNTFTQLPNGTVVYNLTMGFDWLIDAFNQKGFEADVDFIIKLGEVTFIPANLDFQTSETDGYSYFRCKALQTGGNQLLKRRSEIVTNIFSTEDLDGNEVTPAQTQNILLKAKPVTQNSEFKQNGTQTFFHPFLAGGAGEVYYNAQLNIIKGNIEDTLSYLPFYTSNQNNLGDVGFIQAKNDLSNVVLSISLKAEFKKLEGTFTNDPGSRIRFRYGIIQDIENPTTTDIVPFTQSYLNGINGWVISNSNTFLDIELDVNKVIQIPLDYRLIIYFEQETAFLGGGNTEFKITDYEINITATATSIDTVIKGVRYIDVFKENVKRINNFTVDAKRYDLGGEYYDQFAFTGNLIKQRDDLAFPVKFKEITEDLSELNSDYQILPDKIYIGQYQDFYPNKEIGAFLTIPDDTFKFTFNERYAINEYNFKYKTYEQDREEENTTDAIHTESQWLTSNKQVENNKTIDISLIRDAYKIESSRKLGFKETTSTSDDDKMFVIDVVELSPTARGGFSSSMTHNIDSDGRVQLLKDSNLPSWELLGFDVGDEFKILSIDNQGTYEVFEIETTIITLTPITPPVQSFESQSYTTVDYPYTNVLYTNRTNEGLVFFENLLNAENYSNLRYSIKRNIIPWKLYLSTASKFNPNGNIKCTYFKDNGLCITRFQSETENVQEFETILNSELPTPILDTQIYETRLIAPFVDMRDVLVLLNTINEDDSIGGFIRCIDNNEKVVRLYPQMLEYSPATQTLTLTGEQKYDGQGITIIIEGSEVIINEVGYPLDTLAEPYYVFDGDFLKIFDKQKRLVITPTRFNEITINGLVFESSSEMLDYLINN